MTCGSHAVAVTGVEELEYNDGEFTEMATVAATWGYKANGQLYYNEGGDIYENGGLTAFKIVSK